MKKSYLLCLALLSFMYAQAQSTKKVKLADIVKEHELSEKADNTASKNKEAEFGEDEEYQYYRWLWYAKQHTDNQGYLVPQIEAYKIWQQYKTETNKSAAKGTATDQSNWKGVGPYTNDGMWLDYQKQGIGRINTMAFHPSDSETFIVGTAGGGAWITENAGGSWNILTENMMSSAIADIDYNPLNPNTIYICTGDKETFPGKSDSYNSIGLIKSYDGGKTWNTTPVASPVSANVRTNSLIINPQDTNSIMLATNDGIGKSFDGGKTWTDVTPPALFTLGANIIIRNIFELVYKPGDSSTIYSSVTLKDTSLPAYYVALIRSTDGGMNWNILGAIPNAVRAAIAVTPAKPNLVKMIVANSSRGLEGIYSSNNSGNSFSKIFSGGTTCSTNILSSSVSGNKCGGQGEYDLCIAIDPTDIKHLVIGGVYNWESRDSGYTWKILTQGGNDLPGVAVVHPDHHFLGYSPLTADLFDCNDGGVYALTQNPFSPLPVWNNLSSGMNITQYYRNAVSGNASFVLGGAQDNGSSLIDRSTKLSIPVGPGDGADCQIDPVDPNLIYVCYIQGHYLLRWDISKPMNWGTMKNLRDSLPSPVAGAWITPLIIDPNDHNRLYAGYQSIFTSPDKGEHWTAVSTNFSQLISRLAMSKASAGTIYATEEYGNNIHFTHDGGASWTTITHPYSEYMISDIQVDHKNKKQLWITFPGYGTNKTKVASYNDGAWKTMNENLPDLPVYCLVQDTANGTLYIGSYTGIYYRTPTMTQWELFSTNHPIVNVNDLGINYKTGELVSATWGRGMWASPKYEQQLSIPKGIPYAQNVIKVFPNPSNGRFTILDNQEYFKDKTVSTRLIDITGKEVWKAQQSFSGYTLSVDAGQVPTGSYIVEITGKDGKTAKERIIIKQ